MGLAGEVCVLHLVRFVDARAFVDNACLNLCDEPINSALTSEALVQNLQPPFNHMLDKTLSNPKAANSKAETLRRKDGENESRMPACDGSGVAAESVLCNGVINRASNMLIFDNAC